MAGTKILSIPRAQLIKSDKDTHFSGALAQNAAESESLTGFSDVSGVIEQVSLISDQNLDWELMFFATSGFDDADYDADFFLGAVRFVAADGKQIAGVGGYYYCTANMALPFEPITYIDKTSVDAGNNSGSIYCVLVNRSATGKNAGATGEVAVNIVIRPDTEIDISEVA